MIDFTAIEDPGLFEMAFRIEIYLARAEVRDMEAADNYIGILQKLSQLAPLINLYLNKVRIYDGDTEQVRLRVFFLKEIENMYRTVADFSVIREPKPE